MKRTSRILAAVLSLALLITIVAALPATAYAAISTGVVATGNTGRLNLRAAPTEASVSLGMYYNGTAFDILEFTSATWVCVRVGDANGGQFGYFSRRFVQETTIPTNFPNMKPSIIPSYSVSPLTILSYPKPGANILQGSVQPTDYYRIEVLGDIDDDMHSDWHHVIYHGVNGDITGFIQGGLLGNAAVPTPKTYVISAPGPSFTLNLRRSMSTLGAAIGAWYNGTTVTVLDETPEWAHVRIGDEGAATISGYMLRSYLSPSGQYVIDRRPTRYLKQDGRYVSIYYNPSLSSISDKTYSPYTGTPFTVLGESNGWLHVIDQNSVFVGWIEKTNFQ
jgi:uncharacterized protein YgiM (DUF1202 family)